MTDTKQRITLIEGLDGPTLAAMQALDVRLLRNMLEGFAPLCRAELAYAKQAHLQHQGTELVHALHRLRGEAFLIGAKQLGEAIGQLEQEAAADALSEARLATITDNALRLCHNIEAWLTQHRAALEPATGSAPVSSAGHLEGEHRPTLLIVDDSPRTIVALSKMLEKDYEVCFATQGAQALSLLPQVKPSLVLLDMHLPDQSGGAVLAQIQALPNEDRPVVIGMSANAQAQAAALAGGAAGFIEKPVDGAELKALFKHVQGSQR